MADNALAGGGVGVGTDESAGIGIIEAALEVVQPQVGIVVVATVAQGVDIADDLAGNLLLQ